MGNNTSKKLYWIDVKIIKLLYIYTEKYSKKNSLVNKTHRHETETRPRHLVFSPRRDQDHLTFPPDRDIGKIGLKTVSRSRRWDRDYNPDELWSRYNGCWFIFWKPCPKHGCLNFKIAVIKIYLINYICNILFKCVNLMTGAFWKWCPDLLWFIQIWLHLLERQLFSKYDGFSLPVCITPKDDAILPIPMQDSKTYMKLGYHTMKFIYSTNSELQRVHVFSTPSPACILTLLVRWTRIESSAAQFAESGLSTSQVRVLHVWSRVRVQMCGTRVGIQQDWDLSPSPRIWVTISTPNASFFILKCNEIAIVSAPGPAGGFYIMPPIPLSCLNLGSRRDPTEYIWWYHTVEQLNPLSIFGLQVLSWGLYLDHHVYVFEKHLCWNKAFLKNESKSLVAGVHPRSNWGVYNAPKDTRIRLGSKSGPSSSLANSWICHWGKIDFHFNYTPHCTVSSMI